jgi:hypothetical protein
MNLFNVLPGFQKTPAGLERLILSRLPRVLWLGTLLLVLASLLVRVWPWSAPAAEVAGRIAAVDIGVASLVVLHWTAVLTVGIGAFIVMVMKGPAYVADAYPLPDAERPVAKEAVRVD